MSVWWSIASAITSLIGVASALSAVHNRAKYLTTRQDLDRLNMWIAHMANPRETPAPEPLEDEERLRFTWGKRDYEPNDDIGAIVALMEQHTEPPDFFELAPEAEEVEMLNIANRQLQQVGMDEPEFEKAQD